MEDLSGRSKTEGCGVGSPDIHFRHKQRGKNPGVGTMISPTAQLIEEVLVILVQRAK